MSHAILIRCDDDSCDQSLEVDTSDYVRAIDIARAAGWEYAMGWHYCPESSARLRATITIPGLTRKA